MDIQQAIEDATGAALKAIQAMENAHLGRAAHPRSGDLSYPDRSARKAAPSASAAPWNARSAPSTRTNSATRCSTSRAAAAAAPAWAPARCA
jgi:heterodisulfide reductase subunit A-like polyferredoxin